MNKLYQFTDLTFEDFGKNFKKQFGKLPQRGQEAFETTLGKILTGTLSGGNQFETIESIDNLILYSVRLDISLRFLFEVDITTNLAKPIAVGTHDRVYERALKAWREQHKR